MRRLMMITWAAAAAMMAACGGSGLVGTPTTTGSGGSGGAGSTPTVSGLNVTTSSTSILSDGSQTATITALVTDSKNNLIAGVPVSFVPSSGGVAVTQATTDTSGAAVATLSTAGDSSLRTITVKATAGSLTKSISVQVVSGTSPATVSIGAALDGTLKNQIKIGTSTLSAGGTTSLTVYLLQADGSLYANAATVSFQSPCQAQSLATITSPVTTSTGVATATYTATGCNTTATSGDVITATTTIGSNSLSASGTVTVAAASVGSIVYKSASSTIISLKGSGTAAHPETATVVFQVVDHAGAPYPNASVSFALDTAVGGISVTAGPVVSDATGSVQTTVQAGTVATPVRVTATVQNTTPVISTQSNQLSVSTGVPTQNSFSLAVACHNVEAFNTDGVVVKVTARLADRFSNPVADGTAIQFNSEGGQIQPQCTTSTTVNADGSTLSGACIVDWVSSNPRPTIGAGGRAGRSTIFATAIGEESFIDANGNGAFDAGETWTDLPERFRDDNENGVFEPNLGEYFYDFNNNGIRDPADGLFNGVLCNDPAHCDSTKSSTGIAAHNLIIMSGTTPAGLSPSNAAPLAAASKTTGTAFYQFTVADVNNNPMPSGTTVTATVVGTGLTMSTGIPSSYTYPCTTEPIVYAFSVTVAASAVVGATSGQLILDVKTPGGVETFVNYTLPVSN